ncbi:plasmid partitioning protein RepB [Rhizobium sp. L1K21]|uniref:plasmid partitioning protein RepB n=1 Tax=Rhizobium sp. L1K21 TaxID=2954933 RepID=UPI002092322F|nr:plasmid partitioning protein RepB [Rhizobium sp. L1K21]MCO6188362.1 plasmid partitioning protein RepB [Rhizobium sp. L1K21]
MAARDRKNSLKALFGEPSMPAPAPETKSQPATAAPAADTAPANAPAGTSHQPQRASSGAVKAMGLSLNNLSREADEARALREAVEQGERIVDLDPARIVSSFVSDRLSEGEEHDPEFLSLVESMRESGQQVPILVRPHAEEAGRFQVAYGHRRLKAAIRLGRPVKAIVRALSDDELVLAQGKENAERRNLSFIERALFAKLLTERGFDRKLVGEALTVQKSELSRLLQVADAVPTRFARAVGPAPKAGRERWMALAEIFEKDVGAESDKAADLIHSDAFKAADTDKRFQLLFTRLKKKPVSTKSEPKTIRAADGAVIAHLDHSGKSAKLAFSSTLAPEFVDRIEGLIIEEYARFAKDKEG